MLTHENRASGRGWEARLRLPLWFNRRQQTIHPLSRARRRDARRRLRWQTMSYGL